MRVTANDLQAVFKAKPASVDIMQLLGYELIDNIMVDNSGFGHTDEYADTPGQFLARLGRIVADNGTVTAKITSAGMFQVYIGLFTKTGVKRAKTIASNCYLIDDGDGKQRIRLYDTDILTANADGTLTVNNGGYATRTTHKRIMQFSTLHASSKKFETYINGTNLAERSTFEGRLTV